MRIKSFEVEKKNKVNNRGANPKFFCLIRLFVNLYILKIYRKKQKTISKQKIRKTVERFLVIEFWGLSRRGVLALVGIGKGSLMFIKIIVISNHKERLSSPMG